MVGLAAVAIVPLVQSTYYNHFIQYLVALAVGSLTGDAMLHLLPHAIVKSAMENAHAERCHNERQTVLKGLRPSVTPPLGTPTIDAPAAPPRRKQQRRRATRLLGAKSCDDIFTTGLSSKALRSIDTFKNAADCSSDDEEGCRLLEKSQPPKPEEDANSGRAACCFLGRSERRAVVAPTLPGAAAVARRSSRRQPPPLPPTLPPKPANPTTTTSSWRKVTGTVTGTVTVTVTVTSMVSVAWMVIFGDGLHNFTDGLAIGAAFAQSITGGISTSIAVFCHELPHELGDFAVLLKTGMRVKQALMYNILSSGLAAVGMVIGIFLGNVTSASYWIFAITGGIFIYISLVDMLPELNLVNVKPGESRIAHFFLQNVGIMTGVGVMFTIARIRGGHQGDAGRRGEEGRHGRSLLRCRNREF
uniref:Zinc transporter ZIP10 n=1 Tax=Macrostomum lignano TaxID=282301 RepID=A0A1I8FMS0_9PLAT